MIIFDDMDGVLCNFIKGAANLFGIEYDELMKKWKPGCYDMESILGISREDFFNRITSAGEDYWANIPEFPHTRELYDYCCKMATTRILSAPTYDPRSLSGKLKWLQARFGYNFRDYIFTARKEDCAANDRVLIDDHELNIRRFKECGGHGILWPAIYNKRHQEAENAFEIVKKELDTIAKLIDGNGKS
jgi:5'(3')-deoxyribonucleotidase